MSAPMSPAALKRSQWKFVAHLNMGRVHITQHEAVDFPGFVVSRAYDRRADTTTRTFLVAGDKREFTNLREAGHAWNQLHANQEAA